MDHKQFDYQGAIDQLREQFKLDFAAVALVQSAEERFVLTWQFASGNINERYKRIVLQSGKGIAGIVFKTGKPELIQDVQADIDAHELFNYPIIVAERLVSLGAVPLWSNRRVTGVVLAGFRDNKRLTTSMFEVLQEAIIEQFGPIYDKEMANH
ncbi:GAF domain-containing protein [Paenibacillus sp. 1001270B_150601_E10]|uniref:GAF domain-containing protein n=1 Tax=Paenibacillus sp. 1001270B_150601_E10 TaxID=2787079 RepID=UPI00189DBED9|nr:GAF domain-containing protein [Paenibacillus sp. 1001270B_150601_E10]